MKALLTGGTGFVGAAVARALTREGWQVRALVRPNSDRRNLAGLDVELAQGSLADVTSLERAAFGCAALFHVAADPGETRDLAATEPDRLRAMAAEVDAWLHRPARSATRKGLEHAR